jgi:hypothetical protein
MDRRWVSAAIAVVLAGPLAGSPAAAAPVAPATGTRPAIRDISFAPGAQCDIATAQALSLVTRSRVSS